MPSTPGWPWLSQVPGTLSVPQSWSSRSAAFQSSDLSARALVRPACQALISSRASDHFVRVRAEGFDGLHPLGEVGVELERGGAGPGFDRRAAVVAVDEPDGHVQAFVQVATEEVAHGGEGADGFGRADLPRHAVKVGQRSGFVHAGNGDEADLRVVGGGDLGGGVVGPLDPPRHVGLTAAKPDLTDQHVGEADRGVAAAHRDDERVADRERGKFGGPVAVGVGRGGGGLVAGGDGDFGPRLGPAPHGQGDVALQDHVVAEQGGDAQRCGRGGRGRWGGSRARRSSGRASRRSPPW